MHTFAVTISTESMGAVEIYRGDDFNAAFYAYRTAVPKWMTKEAARYRAYGYCESHGNGAVDISLICPSCGMGTYANIYGNVYCDFCGAEFL